MKWQDQEGSNNIEDRRLSGGGGMARAGGVGGLGVVAIVVIGYFLGIDVTPLLNDPSLMGQPTQTAQTTLSPEEKAAGQFASVTLADTEKVWGTIFTTQLGRTYHPTTMVLFSGATPSACGTANAATGPFYCPGDKKVYLDTAFFTTLSRQLGAGGDFASAYVVAHEVGHHVQDELGILGKADAARSQSSETRANAISVRLELQADCFAGVWARAAQDKLGVLEPGDIAEAMNAASKIGDDTLQRNAGRTPMPDSFTHGTSAQRQRWFNAGYQNGKVDACDTFSATNL